MTEYAPTSAPQVLCDAYWPAYHRVESELEAKGIDQLYAEAEAFFAGLRAVEAAVRADQIEKDAAIADMQGHLWSGSGSTAAFRTADTIRAQLTERNTDE